ncbi:MAG: tRNA (cytidine(56)-2'-O)-methyltransferase, partial [Thermoplasmata archaeon]
IVMIIERHIGAGILEGEAVALGLPERDYVPETLEEKIVSHADNLIAGDRRVTLKETVADLIRRGLRDAAVRTVKLHEELSQIAGIDVDRII